jgi:hypothetical protein
MSGRAAALAGLVAALLGIETGAAEARDLRGERERREAPAVRGTAFSLLVPIYEHTTLSEGGWRDAEAAKSNRIGVIGSLVSPIGNDWGWRALLGGGSSKFQQNDVGGAPVIDEQAGDFLVGASVFRRRPDFGQAGISYLYRGRETDFTNGNRRNQLGLVLDLFTDGFDWGFDFAYVFGQTEGETGSVGGVPTPGVDRDFDGFAVAVDARWYATDRVSAVLGVELEVLNFKATSGGAPQSNVETTAVGPLMQLTWLPPLGKQSWLALEGSFAYKRLRGSVATGGIPRDDDVNEFGAGASVRIQLPRVDSLKQLIREY